MVLPIYVCLHHPWALGQRQLRLSLDLDHWRRGCGLRNITPLSQGVCSITIQPRPGMTLRCRLAITGFNKIITAVLVVLYLVDLACLAYGGCHHHVPLLLATISCRLLSNHSGQWFPSHGQSHDKIILTTASRSGLHMSLPCTYVAVSIREMAASQSPLRSRLTSSCSS